MSKYAKTTSVSVEKTKVEIEQTLKKYGAYGFAYATQNNQALIMFEAHGKRIRFILNLPDFEAFKYTPSRNMTRSSESQIAEHEQACRSTWRALLLIIKAKLESVESGISMFEEEFLANIVLPNNQTVSQYLIPQLNQSYSTNSLPPMIDFGKALKKEEKKR